MSGGFWGLLCAPAVFFLPGLGLIAMAGPFVSTLVGILDGALLIGGVSALGAALIELDAPKNEVAKYENALTVDSYVLIVHGAAAEAHEARRLQRETHVTEPASHREDDRAYAHARVRRNGDGPIDSPAPRCGADVRTTRSSRPRA